MSSPATRARVNEDRREVLVGAILIVVGLGVGAALMTGLGDRLRPRIVLHVDFDGVGGLKENAPVRISGREVGKIRAIKLGAGPGEPPMLAPARVDLAIRPDAARFVRRNSEVYVGRQGIIGESYVEIGPPRSERSERAPGDSVRDGDALRGLDPPRIDELLAKIYASLMTGSQLLHEEEPTIRDMLAAAASLDRTLAAVAPPGTLGRLYAQTRDAISETRALVATAREATDDLATPRRIAASFEAVTARADEVRRLADRADALLALANDLRAIFTPERRAALAHGADVARDTAARVDRMLADARFMVAAIERGDVSIGKFARDRDLVDEIKEAHRILKSQPAKALGKPPKEERR